MCAIGFPRVNRHVLAHGDAYNKRGARVAAKRLLQHARELRVAVRNVRLLFTQVLDDLSLVL